ncbi:MAG: hypothetical protein ACOYN5_10970 [Bacteroidales bacterium]
MIVYKIVLTMIVATAWIVCVIEFIAAIRNIRDANPQEDIYYDEYHKL